MERAIEDTIRDSGHLSPQETDIDSRIGARIRAVRENRDESLRAFAARCGVSASMLSDVERGLKSPTIAILSAIAEGLQVPLSRLVSDEQTLDTGPRIVRADETARVIDPETGVERSNIGPVTAESTVEFLRFVLPPGSSTGGFTAHAEGTIERVFVLAGTLELTVSGKSFLLQPGDAMLYRASVIHALRAVGEAQVDAFLVVERP